MDNNIVIDPSSETEVESSSMTALELLAIQAMMNPSREESDEEEFLWSGKLEDL